MSSCVFCKIINHEIPGHILFENNNILVFLDISQTTKGHTLIIPKKHISNVFDMSEEDMAHVFSAVPRIANALKTAFNVEGMNIVNNNEIVAGQTVFHYHVHLIPRYEKTDSFQINYTNNMEQYSTEDLMTLKDEVKKKLID